MTNIKHVAVIGSGVMGSAIAAHIANSNTKVTLFDIVPEDASDRRVLAKEAIARLKKANPAALVSKQHAQYITPANLDDDLDVLAEVDWVIEAVVERLDVKQTLYALLDKHCAKDTVISSNTSTIPLKDLSHKMPESFSRRFMITHFFNPPRYMRLLEIVGSTQLDDRLYNAIRDFADEHLGKTVVSCFDTPGFIANRIGCYWLTLGLVEAKSLGVRVEEADSVMRAFGIPKTGVFGLMDLIGIDLMPLIADAFSTTLSKDDPFIQHYRLPDMVKKMIKEGYTGRKGKGGFYRLDPKKKTKTKQAKNLQNGRYADAIKPILESIKRGRKDLNALFEADDIGSAYAKAVMIPTLAYAASLVGEIAEDVNAIDQAMRDGYNWKYGPFELIDRLQSAEHSGAVQFAKYLLEQEIEIPEYIKQVDTRSIYSSENNERLFVHVSGRTQKLPISDQRWMLHDKKQANALVKKNASAALWDIGDDILCLEFTSKMNSLDPFVLDLIDEIPSIVQSGHRGLVIANDADNFCVGANIGVLLFAANVGAWKQIKGIIEQGQRAYMGLKYAPFPVVAAPSGMALGGGCELLMHADHVQAHIETYTGLVEVGVGIVPGWGGCKEMILRQISARLISQKAVAKMGRMFSFLSPIKTVNTMPAISKAFEYIATAKVSKSAVEARHMGVLRQQDGITMNRSRLLPDAKSACLSLAGGYVPPEATTLSLPGKTAKTALTMAIESFVKNGKATEYDKVVSLSLANVLSGGQTDITKTLSEQDLLDLEVQMFMELIKNQGTLDRLEHMLDVGKPLRN